MKGKILVEQVDTHGDTVIDYDTSLSTAELYNRIKKYFPKIYRDSDKIICGEYKERKYAIRIKNVTYLGRPHPIFKKRIQIPDDLQVFYKKAKAQNMVPLLLGLYTHDGNEIFCDFNIEDFIDKKAHNSSAHVYTSDLVDAAVNGIFQKKDYRGNQITAFRPDMITAFLENIFEEDSSDADTLFGKSPTAKTTQDAGVEDFSINSISQDSKQRRARRQTTSTFVPGDRVMPAEVISAITKFFMSEKKVWNGIDCYQKMISANYRNKYQPEWAGFFLEYEFELFIRENRLSHLVKYAQDKSTNGIDLDLYFPTIECYGDLKAHSENSRGIQGNDWDTIFSIINSDTNNHIFYIVCEHSTVKDSDCDYALTHYWNKVQNKSNLRSYSKKMKNSVELKKFYILDINRSNKNHLTMFRQGVNSNGKLRPPKIMIEHDKLEEFIIAEVDL